VHDQHERPQDAREVETAGDLDLVLQSLQLSFLMRPGAEHLDHDAASVRASTRAEEQRVLVAAERLGDLETRLAHA
jgi:hypothetical protein